MSLNKVMIIGHVGQEPIIREVSGQKVANIRVATSERYKDKNGETREITEWHSIDAWGSHADLVERFVTKSTTVYIEGKLTTRSYESDGVKKSITTIKADNLQWLANPKEKGKSAPQPKPSSAPIDNKPEEGDDDLPF